LRVTARLAQRLGQITPMIGRAAIRGDWPSVVRLGMGAMCSTKCALRHTPPPLLFSLLASSAAANCSAVFRRGSKATTRQSPAAGSEGQSPSLDSQTLAAFGAACIDHSAATFGFHTHEETVGAGAASFGRLVSAFHDAFIQKLNGLWLGLLVRLKINHGSSTVSTSATHDYRRFHAPHTRAGRYFSCADKDLAAKLPAIPQV
jgi:hypothetical protein